MTEGDPDTEARLEEVASHIPGFVYRRVRHTDGRIELLVVGGGAHTVCAKDGEWIDSSEFISHLHPEDAEGWLKAVDESAATMQAYSLEFRVVSPTMGVRWWRSSANPRRRSDGAVVWDGVALDVTDLRNAERRAKDHAGLLTFILESGNACAFDWNIETGEVFWSEAIRNLIGPVHAEPSYELWRRLLHPEDVDRVEKELSDALMSRQTEQTLEYRVMTPRGVRWISSTAHMSYAIDGRPLRRSGVCFDITDRVLLEQQLQAALEARSRFFAAASHDLRQPVQSLTLLLEAIGAANADPPVQKAITTARRATETLRQLLDALLDSMRCDSVAFTVRPVEVDLASLMEALAAEYLPRAEEKGLRMRVVACRHWTRSDPLLLERMVRNLVENALRYTDTGGVLIGCQLRGEMIKLHVFDSGKGIPQHRLADIFHEFVQVCPIEGAGLGLGLSIVSRLGEILGHPVDVASVEGRGTRFTITLPLASRTVG